MWLLRWKKPSELNVNTETALPPVPTSHGGIERKVVAEGLQGGEAHHVGRHDDVRFRLLVRCSQRTFMIEPQMLNVRGVEERNDPSIRRPDPVHGQPQHTW